MTTTRVAALEAALKTFIAETVDYMTRNNLGNPEKQHLVLVGRAALSTPATEPQGYVEGLEAAIVEAVSMLMERSFGNPARSPSHNARLVLQSALAARPAPQPAADTRVVCPECGDTGMRDSGGVHPWGEHIMLPCDHNAPSDKIAEAARDVLAERQRQISAEGWTPEHDDQHDEGEIALAAATYACGATFSAEDRETITPEFWPWDRKWLKMTTPRRDLVKAGALIIAEIERLDRAELAGKGE